MKLLILLLLLPLELWAKPLVLISYFDAFNRAPYNNSERIALELERRLNQEASPVTVKLCALNTIFDKAFAQSEDCLKANREAILMVGLGESTCEVKVEAMMRNNDKTGSPDNAGNHRHNTPVVAGAPKILGMNYPLPKMYCALTPKERRSLEVSNFAGTFVCNNTAYQMSHFYPEMQYGFIHVPANNCENLGRKNPDAIAKLEKMILAGAAHITTLEVEPERLPTMKAELKILRQDQRLQECEQDFYQRLKGADEKRSIFSGLMN